MKKNKMPFKEISKIYKECPVCEKEVNLSYGEAIETLNVRGEAINVITQIYHCPMGDHFFHSPEDEETKFQDAYKEYKKRKGLLQSEEILRIREQYGLTQKSLAALLGWGDVTLSRYETGAIQDDAHNLSLLWIRDFDGFKKLFELRGKALAPTLAKDIADKIVAIEKEKAAIEAAVEKERSISMATKVFSMSKQTQPLPVTPIQWAEGLYYSNQDDNSQVVSNNELALAA